MKRVLFFLNYIPVTELHFLSAMYFESKRNRSQIFIITSMATKLCTYTI